MKRKRWPVIGPVNKYNGREFVKIGISPRSLKARKLNGVFPEYYYGALHRESWSPEYVSTEEHVATVAKRLMEDYPRDWEAILRKAWAWPQEELDQVLDNIAKLALMGGGKNE